MIWAISPLIEFLEVGSWQGCACLGPTLRMVPFLSLWLRMHHYPSDLPRTPLWLTALPRTSLHLPALPRTLLGSALDIALPSCSTEDKNGANSAVRTLGFGSELGEFKSKHCKADTAGPLSKALIIEVIALDTSVCQVPYWYLLLFLHHCCHSHALHWTSLHHTTG